jgi:hypothetical protein
MVSISARDSAPFARFLLSGLAKTLLLAGSGLSLAVIVFGRFLGTPVAEWPSLWLDARGAAVAGLAAFLAWAFLLTVLETMIRAGAVALLGKDLFRVSALVGILVVVEAMAVTTLLVTLGAGFLNVSGLDEAVVMGGAAAAGVLIWSVMHSYLLLVRYCAVAIMRSNADI